MNVGRTGGGPPVWPTNSNAILERFRQDAPSPRGSAAVTEEDPLVFARDNRPDAPSGAGTWQIVATVSLGTTMLVLSGTVLNIALPLIAGHYRAGPLAATWVVLGFMLVQTSLLVVCGRLADRFDRRKVYLSGLALFTLASLAAAAAPTIEVLIVLRTLQGIAAAMAMANGTALIAAAVPKERLSQSMGVYLGALGVAPLLGPSLGGYLADTFGWQWVFLMDVPVGLTALVWGVYCLPRAKTSARDPIDAVGAALLTGWLALLVLVVSQTGSGDWRSAPRLVPLLLCPLLFAVFVLHQRRSRSPLIDPGLFAARAFVLGNLAAPLSAVGMVGMAFLIALFLQNVQGMSTVEAGIAVLAGPLAGMVAPPISGRLGARFPPRRIAVCGTVAAAAGLALLATYLAEDTPYPLIAAGMVLVCAGAGVFYTANTTLLIMGVPAERLGVVNGVRLTVHFLGVSLSPAICLAVVSSRLAPGDRHVLYASAETRPGAAVRDALVSGYRLSFWIFAVAALVCAFLVSRLSGPAGPTAGPDDPGRPYRRPAGGLRRAVRWGAGR
ncbi:DHA2 family efflux MFS transporter permease subunit [Spirillospora albida]|uniref:DHA2 family efflux MFS transporter permease subunit n=1 Tax=Spirillospora albida TaxID=58123 RepID=UPI000689CD29|nr:DHA2 family efflux MFS transporter permease subunit [Spirillospora albida]